MSCRSAQPARPAKTGWLAACNHHSPWPAVSVSFRMALSCLLTLCLLWDYVLGTALRPSVAPDRLSERPIHRHFAGATGVRQEGRHFSGYFKLARTHEAFMYYQLHKSRSAPSMDPLLLWMTGGPGASSLLALYEENGPFRIANNLTLASNHWGWDTNASNIYLDQPIGVGFSYSEDTRDAVSDERGVANDVVDFLLALLQAHPELANLDFYLTGESYAGHYIPAVATAIRELNKLSSTGPVINLKGLAIGNGMTAPGVQLGAYADFALMHSLIGPRLHHAMKAVYPSCRLAADLCNNASWLPGICALADTWCTATQYTPVTWAAGPDFNVYNIRAGCPQPPLCYDFLSLELYLNLPQTQAALGVHRRYYSLNDTVGQAFKRDLVKRYDLDLVPLLEDGVRVMLYNGLDDFTCNWLGTERWINALPWIGSAGWAASGDEPWHLTSKPEVLAGTARSHGPLTFVKVASAGHLVPMDQPEAAHDLLMRFLTGTGFGPAQGHAQATESLGAVHKSGMLAAQPAFMSFNVIDK